MDVGKRGGRELRESQPYSTEAAAPHTRPWHAPMPQRVWSFACVHEVQRCKSPCRTSSQRQTTVCGSGRCRSSGRGANRRASERTNGANAVPGVAPRSRSACPLAAHPAQ